MKLFEAANADDMGRMAAEIFREEIARKPDLTLGLATGTSPIPLYRELVELCRCGKTDFSRVRTINLDEYVGLGAGHPQSYRYFMDTHLFDHINIDKAATGLPDGCAADLDRECARYDGLIEGLGYADLQLLGVGHNGHIGFNEPAPLFSRQTAVVDLTDSTIKANGRLFDDPAQVPRRAISMSIRHIMLARRIVLIATATKNDIIRKAFGGDITPQVPASALQMHPDVTVILSRE
ncbi:MAG: glucosamine-6-phosphate deaminase [Clostridiales Family XIII bacterium]|jgi:glucosamine-6-phosphate deaminase|nr:glucosamine-6-phosphate deaminase [Clostridiales Family XIII bacterium]